MVDDGSRTEIQRVVVLVSGTFVVKEGIRQPRFSSDDLRCLVVEALRIELQC